MFFYLLAAQRFPYPVYWWQAHDGNWYRCNWAPWGDLCIGIHHNEEATFREWCENIWRQLQAKGLQRVA